eukprot:CAMPEP_0119552920 /NCGR_PEP_ID=MMETSP1352-20130426/5799_1 /TAXON_ID=265584 /ORGANISM="Stauroneis constricta, Strain CCMP1120" /LENGTH=403 /DNA_ID=CAMNT_0007599235 /DNA_START=56 /DNA_END=1267 /DNA_ORIENTATION=-
MIQIPQANPFKQCIGIMESRGWSMTGMSRRDTDDNEKIVFPYDLNFFDRMDEEDKNGGMDHDIDPDPIDEIGLRVVDRVSPSYSFPQNNDESRGVSQLLREMFCPEPIDKTKTPSSDSMDLGVFDHRYRMENHNDAVEQQQHQQQQNSYVINSIDFAPFQFGAASPPPSFLRGGIDDDDDDDDDDSNDNRYDGFKFGESSSSEVHAASDAADQGRLGTSEIVAAAPAAVASMPDRHKNKTTPSAKFRSHHPGRWCQRYKELEKHKQQHGHCSISPAKNKVMAQWMKRQRFQYRLKHAGKHSTLTDERERKLNDLGFVWDTHDTIWEQRFQELVAFKSEYGHTNVPAGFSGNQQLGIWVKGQRRAHALQNLQASRYERLAALGFQWTVRVPKRAATAAATTDTY